MATRLVRLNILAPIVGGLLPLHSPPTHQWFRLVRSSIEQRLDAVEGKVPKFARVLTSDQRIIRDGANRRSFQRHTRGFESMRKS